MSLLKTERIPLFEQTFKNIDNTLWKDAGCSSELDYIEQTSWILFLKYLDDLEKERADSAELRGEKYAPIIDPKFRWNVWAAPRDTDGKIDHHKAMTGEDLINFVDGKLFPYLKKFKTSAEHPDTIEYKIGEIFSELKNRLQSGYNLREVINLVDELRFQSSTEKHEMSALYEDKIQNMGNAGRNGGEYYTPRPLIKTIIKVLDPKVGERFYDGAGGSMGFPVEAFEYMKARAKSAADLKILQEKTFYAKEKKSLAYIIGTMNMILHGIEAPNILHTNTLAENIFNIQDGSRYHVIGANPPFGGKERAEVQQNFPIKTGETAFLFLQHFIKSLKVGGRAGVKTIVLFFEKGKPTRKVWFYQLNLERNLGKTNPLNENDLADFLKLQKTKADSDNSWTVNVADLERAGASPAPTYDLSVKNPHKQNEAALREPREILDEMQALDEESASILKKLQKTIVNCQLSIVNCQLSIERGML
jgi:type I restriction enzyme M protein